MKKALIIVDVQTDYGTYYSYSYLKKLYSFIRDNSKDYEKIYSLYEPLVDKELNFSKDNMISFVAENSIPVCKLYDDLYVLKLLNADKESEAVSIFHNLNTNSIKVDNGELIIRRLERCFLPGNEYRIEFISNQMLDMINDINDNGYEVDIIGGGLTKCVKITDEILTLKGINTNIIENLCYQVRVVNSNRHENIFKKKPAKYMFKKDLLNIDGSLRTTEMPIGI